MSSRDSINKTVTE